MLALTAATIGIPLGIDAAMQQRAESKAERMHQENLQIARQQQPDLLTGHLGSNAGAIADYRSHAYSSFPLTYHGQQQQQQRLECRYTPRLSYFPDDQLQEGEEVVFESKKMLKKMKKKKQESADKQK